MRVIAPILLCVAVLGAGTPAAAVTVPTPRLVWDMPDTASADAVTRWVLTVDDTTTQVIVQRDGNTFSTPLPVLTPGTHTLIVSACDALTCAASAPLVVKPPSAPVKLRIQIVIEQE